MSELYFAYGSNLAGARLRGRVPSARALGPAWLPGFTLRVDKQGRDGSAKANIHPQDDEGIWGVVYRLEAAEWPALDLYEGGYRRFRAEALRSGGRRGLVTLRVETYRSDLLAADPVAARWYRRLMVEGAREHGLPPDWCALLEALPAR